MQKTINNNVNSETTKGVFGVINPTMIGPRQGIQAPQNNTINPQSYPIKQSDQYTKDIGLPPGLTLIPLSNIPPGFESTLIPNYFNTQMAPPITTNLTSVSINPDPPNLNPTNPNPNPVFSPSLSASAHSSFSASFSPSSTPNYTTTTIPHLNNAHHGNNNPKKQGLQILFGDDWPNWNYLHSQLSYVTPFHISSKVAQLANHYYGKPVLNLGVSPPKEPNPQGKTPPGFLQAPKSSSKKASGDVRQQDIAKYYPCIWDMFGGLGMDAIRLGQILVNSKIIVSEIDSRVFHTLELNIQTVAYGMPVMPILSPSLGPNPLIEKDTFTNYTNGRKTPNITAYNEDALVRLRDKAFMKTVDLVFFDPPWGNSFKTGEPFSFDNITMSSLNNGKNVCLSIPEILDKIYDKVPNIIIKSPILSDSFERWAQKRGANVLQICEFPAHKLKYLFISS